MKSRIVFYFMMVLVTLCISGCKNGKLAHNMREFMTQTVIIPDDLKKVSGSEVVSGGDIENCPHLVIFYDNLSCSSCTVNKLPEYQRLFDWADSLQTFDVMIIFSPEQGKYKMLVNDIALMQLPNPVYIDSSHVFHDSNRLVSENEYFHAFLMDRQGKPVFVGNPLANERLKELFFQALDILTEEGNLF